MSTEIIVVPDGKYFMPLSVFKMTDVSRRKGGYHDEVVRFTIENGECVQFNDASLRFYRTDSEGIRLTRGFTFIGTVDELKAISTDLPYSWRL